LVDNKRYLSYSNKYLHQVKEMLKAVDVVLEVVDARAPWSTKSKSLANSTRGHLLVLNKSDLAEDSRTREWLAYYQKLGIKVISYHNRLSVSCFNSYLKHFRSSRPKFKRPLRLMVAGMPNVGKSTLVNLLLHKKVSRTGNRPGITRGNQWIRLNQELEMLDTPGVLQPFAVNHFSFNCLAVLGVIPDHRFDEVELGGWLIDMLYQKDLLNVLVARYGINLEQKFDIENVLLEVGKSRGCLGPGGKIDQAGAARHIIKDFQEAALGKVTLETPDMIEEN